MSSTIQLTGPDIGRYIAKRFTPLQVIQPSAPKSVPIFSWSALIKSGAVLPLSEYLPSRADIKLARKLAKYYGVKTGLLSGIGANPKLNKSDELDAGYLSDILHLMPDAGSGVINVCPSSSAECRDWCLGIRAVGAGIPVAENTVIAARIARTRFLAKDPQAFLWMLYAEVLRHAKRCAKYSVRPACRLNGTSDCNHEATGIMTASDELRSITYYDYTKIASRAHAYANGQLPANYHLTFSADEEKPATADAIIQRGVNVAKVYDSKRFPITDTLVTGGLKYYVVSGADSDLRILDPRASNGGHGLIIALDVKISNALKARGEFSGCNGFVNSTRGIDQPNCDTD